jgi:hypothetical protein
MIPDEAFFATLIRNHFSGMLVDPKHDTKQWTKMHIVNSCQRFLNFPTASAHPEEIQPHHLEKIGLKIICNDAVACRKVVKQDIRDSLDVIRDLDHDRIYGANGFDPSLNESFADPTTPTIATKDPEAPVGWWQRLKLRIKNFFNALRGRFSNANQIIN